MAKRKTRFNTGGVADEYSPELRDPANMEPGLEGVYPEAWLPIGRIAKGTKAAIDAGIGMLPNRVKNVVTEVAPGKSTILSGRLPNAAEDVTHAYRNMSRAELDSALSTGRLRRTPENVKTDWDKAQKFWSPGDEAGAFGRGWKGAAEETVRSPIRNVQGKNWAVKRENLERLNKETGKFEPLKKGGIVKAKPTKARGCGIAKRGLTKGKVR